MVFHLSAQKFYGTPVLPGAKGRLSTGGAGPRPPPDNGWLLIGGPCWPHIHRQRWIKEYQLTHTDGEPKVQSNQEYYL